MVENINALYVAIGMHIAAHHGTWGLHSFEKRLFVLPRNPLPRLSPKLRIYGPMIRGHQGSLQGAGCREVFPLLGDILVHLLEREVSLSWSCCLQHCNTVVPAV